MQIQFYLLSVDRDPKTRIRTEKSKHFLFAWNPLTFSTRFYENRGGGFCFIDYLALIFILIRSNFLWFDDRQYKKLPDFLNGKEMCGKSQPSFCHWREWKRGQHVFNLKTYHASSETVVTFIIWIKIILNDTDQFIKKERKSLPNKNRLLNVDCVQITKATKSDLKVFR